MIGSGFPTPDYSKPEWLRKRLGLLIPFWLLYLGDVTLTLCGQSADYWNGEYASVVEYNPLAHRFLAGGPAEFLAFAAIWILCQSALFLCWRHPISTWLAVVITIAHAFGGASWFLRMGSYGWFGALVYLLICSEIAGWFWTRYGKDAPRFPEGIKPSVEN